MSQTKTKPHHITNIRYPYAKTWDRHNYYVEFELANINVSMANAIRRIILSNVNSAGFRTEPYSACSLNVIANDTPLHNQFILHRIAMVPIHITKPDSFDYDDYNFIINVENNSNALKTITSEDFQIKQISTNKMLSRDEVKQFFPPDPITGNYIILDKLRPKYFVPHKNLSKEVIEEMARDFSRPNEDIMRFHIEGKALSSNGRENGHFCPVSCACYINTVDPNKAALGLKEYIEKHNEIAKLKNITGMTPEQLTRRFDLTERARFFYTNDKNEANVFTFKIETIGVIPSLVIFHRAIDILKDKITTFVGNLVNKNENVIKINNSSQLNGGYELDIKDEDDTLGNIVQSHLCMLYADFTLPKEQRKLKNIVYKRPHPLEKHVIIAIQGNNDDIDEIITDVIKPGCMQIVKVLSKIQTELEGTQHFIRELKQIN
jgi:DNA-directed RNA polymerase subunit L